ncbi:MAG TPA: protein kinase, partial [Thermoanaerobaculia bacterium]|nr:protein kinase [Thermoanaerobaculia bacterium]
IIGTVHYMSPEQALGKAIDARTDIFSLGVVMYQAATGQLPFRGETVTETITLIVRDEPADPRTLNVAISPWLSEIIRRCMQKKPDDRFATAAELVSALDAGMSAAPTVVTGAKTIERKRRMWIPVLVVLAVVAAIGAMVTLRRDEVKPAAVVKTQRAAPSSTSMNVVAPAPAPAPAPKIVESAPPPPAPAAPDIVRPTPPSVGAGASPAPTPPPRAAEAAAPTLDIAMQQLRAGDWMLARDSFLEIVRTDPQNAPAHLHLGEIFLISHNAVAAQRHFERALENGSALDARERQLAQIGFAIASGQRVVARERLREFRRSWPNDPELRAYERATNDGGRRRWRP